MQSEIFTQEDLTPKQRNMIDCLRLFSEDIETWADPTINVDYRRPSDTVMLAWATTMDEAHKLLIQLGFSGNIYPKETNNDHENHTG